MYQIQFNWIGIRTLEIYIYIYFLKYFLFIFNTIFRNFHLYNLYVIFLYDHLCMLIVFAQKIYIDLRHQCWINYLWWDHTIGNIRTTKISIMYFYIWTTNLYQTYQPQSKLYVITITYIWEKIDTYWNITKISNRVNRTFTIEFFKTEFKIEMSQSRTKS